MRLKFLKRPSPAMGVALVALFCSLGGVGYAAVSIPYNSVGNHQLRNNAVSYKKIQPGAVGYVRANLNQLQARVGQTCSSGSAIGTIQNNGKVTCNNALPAEFGTTNNTASLPTAGAAVSVASVTLPSGLSYLAFANPTVAVTGGGASQTVTATCVLTVGSNTETRSQTIDVTGTSTTYHSIPMQASGPSGTASVSCSSAPDSGAQPTTSVTAAINALQTSSNS